MRSFSRDSSERRSVPDGAGGRRQRAHQVSDVVWNVDGQRGDLRLDRFDGRLRSFALQLLPAGQRRERDLDVCAREPERAPERKKDTRGDEQTGKIRFIKNEIKFSASGVKI